MTEIDTQMTDVGGAVVTTAFAPSTTDTNTPTSTQTENTSSGGAKIVMEKLSDGKTRFRMVHEPAPQTETAPTVESVQTPAVQTERPAKPSFAPAPQVTPQQPFGVDAGNEPRAQPYSIADISTALQAGIPLAQERIPTELVGWYQQKQAEVQQQNAPDLKEQQRAFFRNVAQKAKAEALAELKMTEEDLTKDIDLLDFEEQEALQKKRDAFQELNQLNQSVLLNQVQFQMAQQAQERERQLSVVRGIVEYAEELGKTEPNFQHINNMMRTHYQTLPYQDGAVVKEAIDALSAGTINQKQAEVLRSYYEKTRLAFYADKNNLTTRPQTITTPPVTEKTSGGAYQQAEAPNWGSMRGMTPRERNQFIASILKK